MKYLGIDYGTKRIGLAISDEEGRLAFPKEVMPNTPKLFEKVKDYAKEHGVGIVVIGESKNYAGEDNPIMPSINKLFDFLKGEGFGVFLEPEFMTTSQASKIQGDVEKVDASAAAIILQSYLDKTRNKNKELGIKEAEKLEKKVNQEKITYNDFAKVEMRVGKILSAEKIPDTDKLLKLMVELGEAAPRQIVSGIAAYFPDPMTLVGKNCLFVTNLAPRVIRGYESNGMILALSTPEGAFSLLEPNKDISIGTKVK